MSERDGDLVIELNHKINSPLAAIRYAMYLAGRRSTDPVLLRYLRVAEDEVQSIADTLRQARRLAEQTRPAAIPGESSANHAEGGQSRQSSSPNQTDSSKKKSDKNQKAAA